MNKLGIGAIAAAFAVILLLVSSQTAYGGPPGGPPAVITFSFSGSTAPPIGPAGDISMTGHGAWKVGGQIGAGGTFTTTTGLTGSWHAITLTDVSVATGSGTCPPCTTTSTNPVNVVFTAEFNPRGPASSFIADVIVGTTDIATGIGAVETFWVQPSLGGTVGGFGTAVSTFNSR